MKLPICRHLNPLPPKGDEPYARLCSGCKRYVTWGESVFTRQPGWEITHKPVLKPKGPLRKPGVYEG